MDPTLLSLLDELSRYGEANDARETDRARRMLNITPDTGRLLWILVGAIGARQILEVGTSNAYSTIWLADAVRETGGRIVTLEQNPNKIELARQNLRRAALDEWVDIMPGPASETLARLSGPFDLVFLDADRPSYLAYVEAVLPKLRPMGLLVADNVVSHRAELESYLARVKSDASLFSVTVPIGNGEEISLKLP